ncbi:Y+L amino acid transporter 2-like [Rhagoletis pomonella]|uniref:Y+L amino acid transporter 2-like n=1 Tax=Rhagoletis pomonella TaxID=28610 RepID=UPI0017828340|nr:Y+L amino acid transporter 2-like [Rhagoletis pomonella]
MLFHIKQQTPIPSLIFSCITSLLTLLTADVYILINYFSAMLWLSVVVSIAGMLWLRHSKPNIPRPIKVHLALPLIFIICCLTLVLLPSFTNPMNLIVGIGITVAGIPFYYLCIVRRNKPACYSKLSRGMVTLCRAMFNTEIIESSEKIDK